MEALDKILDDLEKLEKRNAEIQLLSEDIDDATNGMKHDLVKENVRRMSMRGSMKSPKSQTKELAASVRKEERLLRETLKNAKEVQRSFNVINERMHQQETMKAAIGDKEIFSGEADHVSYPAIAEVEDSREKKRKAVKPRFQEGGEDLTKNLQYRPKEMVRSDRRRPKCFVSMANQLGRDGKRMLDSEKPPRARRKDKLEVAIETEREKERDHLIDCILQQLDQLEETNKSIRSGIRSTSKEINGMLVKIPKYAKLAPTRWHAAEEADKRIEGKRESSEKLVQERRERVPSASVSIGKTKLKEKENGTPALVRTRRSAWQAAKADAGAKLTEKQNFLKNAEAVMDELTRGNNLHVFQKNTSPKHPPEDEIRRNPPYRKVRPQSAKVLKSRTTGDGNDAHIRLPSDSVIMGGKPMSVGESFVIRSVPVGMAPMGQSSARSTKG
eukprot:Rmarinus@m.23736